MGSEISQFEIQNRQLLAINPQPRTDMRTDIGEAKITHTIFGRAKVRVIRKQDKTRRVWLLSSLALTVVVVSSLQGWTVLQEMQNAVIPPNQTVRVSAPVFQPEYMSLPTLSPIQGSKSGITPQIGSNDLFSSLKNTQQQTPVLQPTLQIAAKPPLLASIPTDKPQKVPVANVSPAKIQAVVQQPRKPLPPRRPATPTVVAKPAAAQPAVTSVVTSPSATQPIAPTVATPVATQSAIIKPEAVAPLTQPSSKETTPAPSPAITNQSLAPANVQPQTSTPP
jgi:hypothetical protein